MSRGTLDFEVVIIDSDGDESQSVENSQNQETADPLTERIVYIEGKPVVQID